MAKCPCMDWNKKTHKLWSFVSKCPCMDCSFLQNTTSVAIFWYSRYFCGYFVYFQPHKTDSHTGKKTPKFMDKSSHKTPFCGSVRPSVRPSRLPCLLCNIYSSGWILSILATNDHYHERVCRTQWPLTLTYIFKVIWPWLRKSCRLCSVYSSGWILFIFSTNDHYHLRVCRVYPSEQRSCWGGILVSLRPSVRPSVCPSVRPACRVRSVTSAVLDGFFPY